MNIDYIKRRLLVKYPSFGSIIANTNFIAENSIKTAATDGDNIYYNPVFIDTLTYDEKIFVFAHEIFHIGFNHVFRSEGKDPETWNMAADAVANAWLKADDLPLIENCVDIPEAINYDVEEMYDKLLEEKKQKQQNKNQSSNPNQSNREQESSNSKQSEAHDIGHDTHSMWSKAIEKRKKEEQEQNNTVHNKNKSNGKTDETKKLTQMGEKQAFKQNKIEREKQLEEIIESLAKQSQGYSSETNSQVLKVTDIGECAPLIDWRLLLKEAVKYDIDWAYRNAEIEDGVLTPRLEELPIPETEILLDTSGSINEELLRNFLRECKNILQTSKVKVGCFDTEFYGFTEIKSLNDIDNLIFHGRGGTDFNTAVNAFSRRVENKIIFTDGEAPMPDMQIDVIWIVFGGAKINPKGGKVIYITQEQLESLKNPKRRK